MEAGTIVGYIILAGVIAVGGAVWCVCAQDAVTSIVKCNQAEDV